MSSLTFYLGPCKVFTARWQSSPLAVILTILTILSFALGLARFHPPVFLVGERAIRIDATALARSRFDPWA
jgi:hypothetical protein